MKLTGRFAMMSILLGVSCFVQTQVSGAGGESNIQLEKMPGALEVRLALSALPPHLRDDATVYTLDPTKGYMLNRQGTNGMNCLVIRTEWEWPQLAFRDDIFIPISFDSEGSKKIMPIWFDSAKLRARGLTPKQVYEQITKKIHEGDYPKPTRAGISYMVAPLMRTYPAPSAQEVMTMNMPHYMFYGPDHVTDADIGGKPFSHEPFILVQGPTDYIIHLAGETEKVKILEDSKGLLADLCSYRAYLCAKQESHDHSSS